MYNTAMSEVVTIRMTSRSEYDALSKDRIQTEKLARGVLYVLMLEVENDSVRAASALVQLSMAPVFGVDISAEAAPIVMEFLDDDAQPVRTLTGLMKFDQVYLQPVKLCLTADNSSLGEGYFIEDRDTVDMSLKASVFVDASGSID